MCDTMVLVEPGRVLFAKNSDRDPNEAQFLDWRPPRDHSPGTMVRCTWIEIPQVNHTHAVLLSRPFWMWGAEMGTNEHGVVIGNEAVFTREPYAGIGLTGMDLIRLGLERAATASTAVDVVTELLAAHGQGGGCGHEKPSFTYHNSFIVADHRGAFVLETAGRHWAVEEVTAGSRSISNGLTIPGFAEQYADRLRGRVAACAARRAFTEAAAGRAVSPTDLMAVLRSHGPDAGVAPRYALVNGAMSAPCMHAGGIVAASQTTGSWVSELRPDSSQHWATATAAPCTSIFKPVSVADPIDLGPYPDDRADPASLWWRHERFHRVALTDPQRLLVLPGAERDDVERGWVATPPASAGAFREADDLLARWTAGALEQVDGDRRPAFVRRYWQRRARGAGLSMHRGPGLSSDAQETPGALKE